MEKCSRSGQERRKATINVQVDRRIMKDRCCFLVQPLSYIGLLEKIPIFNGLTVNQFKKILRICSKRTLREGNSICRAGEESFQMFVLIKGMLRVVFSDGKELSRISPVEIVGEMGMFTGERRSASVVAAEDSIVLSIHKVELLNLFRKDSDLGNHILMNVIQDMAQKLRRNNAIIEELRQVCDPGVFTSILSKKLEK